MRQPRTLGTEKAFHARKGFTLLELITVMAIIGILAMVVYPTLSHVLPNQRLSSEAKRIESFMQKARVKASNLQKPVRVVINCTGQNPLVNPKKPCWIESQIAVYSGSSVDSWNPEGDRRYMNSSVMVMENNAGYDGDAPVDFISYAIYMPDSRVYSEPRPFDIFVYSSEVDAAVNPKEGWRVTVSNDSGRILTKQDKVTVP
jgi:prepilin-type N-terminal cleavage/methylation domain-containing protein